MKDPKEKTVRVKVSPYPIPLAISTPSGPHKGNILKLTFIGFLAEVPDAFVTGNKLDVQFILPVLGLEFKEPVVVIKVYDQYQGKTDKGAEVYRLVEFHFRTIGQDAKEKIGRFLKKIGQMR